MDTETLTTFFMCCSIINGSLLMLWIGVYSIAPEQVYRTQNKFFPMPRDGFNIIFYAFLGLFKILWCLTWPCLLSGKQNMTVSGLDI